MVGNHLVYRRLDGRTDISKTISSPCSLKGDIITAAVFTMLVNSNYDFTLKMINYNVYSKIKLNELSDKCLLVYLNGPLVQNIKRRLVKDKKYGDKFINTKQ